MTGISVRAVPGDAPDLAAALASEGLPTDDLGLPGRRFFQLRHGETEVGWIGCEALGGAGALLRSLTIAPGFRRRGFATDGLNWLLGRLSAEGVTEVFALTTAPAVAAMLERLGFAILPRAEVPPGLAATRQFSNLCPASAVVLTRRSETMDDTRERVREAYGRIARESGDSCCAPAGCCTPSAEEMSRRMGYDDDDLAAVPEGANLGLGCGNPQAIAELRPGEVVVDLGSGAGFDAFLAARQVGPEGRVIGVDMTPAMLAKARANAAKIGAANVEFRLGEIEALPLGDGIADAVISNCVINLSPDKRRVFAEAFRVLKPGGRLAISDVVRHADLPPEIAGDADLLCGCVSGAATAGEIAAWMAAAGFVGIAVEPKAESRDLIKDWAPGRGVENFVVSAAVSGRKPG